MHKPNTLCLLSSSTGTPAQWPAAFLLAYMNCADQQCVALP